MFNRLRYIFSGKNVVKPAYTLIKCCLILSCCILVPALLLAVYAGDFTARTCRLHFLYAEMFRTPQSIILVASLGALYIDDMLKR